MVSIKVFAEDPGHPSELAATAIKRAEAAARRFTGQVEVLAVALNSAEAAEIGASTEPTVAVGDFVLTIGQAPPAGHLVRAIELALEEAD